MAEEQFTSRRARREAERLKAEQAFEARDTPEQPSDDTAARRAGLLTPTPAQDPPAASAQPTAEVVESAGESVRAPIDAAPVPRVSHERGALATDHPLEERPPVNAEDRLDPQRAPLPHFESRAAKKKYLREHGLSLEGDLSTGAIPVVAASEDSGAADAVDESAEDPKISAGFPQTATGRAGSGTEEARGSTRAKAEGEQPLRGGPEYVPARIAEPESYDAAGFGGAAAEVAARDFESPITADSGPRPVSTDEEPYDALSKPMSALDVEDGDVPSLTTTEIIGTGAAGSEPVDDSAATMSGNLSADPIPRTEEPSGKGPDSGGEAPVNGDPDAGKKQASADTEGRSRRMPIVQPPSTSGVRVVTASSAQIPESAAQRDSAESSSIDDVPETSADDAARALAANPETRPMDAVPEAWSLPNPNYEDEETENPPAQRIRASAVTGHDGRILVGEEPSKVPFIALGIAATVAVALIVIALVMLL